MAALTQMVRTRMGGPRLYGLSLPALLVGQGYWTNRIVDNIWDLKNKKLCIIRVHENMDISLLLPPCLPKGGGKIIRKPLGWKDLRGCLTVPGKEESISTLSLLPGIGPIYLAFQGTAGPGGENLSRFKRSVLGY